MKLVSHSLLSLSLLGLALVAACTGDEPQGNLTRPEDMEVPDAEIQDPSLCPAEEPKVGSTCREDDGTNHRCMYKMGECVRGGQTYVTYYEYCCYRGLWASCPGPETPCDKPPPDQPDAAADAPSPAGAGAGAGG